jgi:SagB-type dehydrogenase family enzyme
MLIVITGNRKRTAQKYPEDALRYMTLEAGHVMQNILLQATALGLVSVPMGSFSGDEVRRVIKSGIGEEPIYMTAVGKPVPH